MKSSVHKLGLKVISLKLFLVICCFIGLSATVIANDPPSCQAYVEDIQHLAKTEGLNCGNTMQEVNECLQRHWYRPDAIERFDAHKPDVIKKAQQQHPYLFKEPSLEFINALNNFSFLDAVIPTNKEFEAVILLGSTINNMRMRIGELVLLAQQHNVRFKRVIGLGSDRAFDQDEEPEAILSFEGMAGKIPGFERRADWVKPVRWPRDENEGWLFLWNQAALPAEWQSIPFEAVTTLAKPNQKRAQTKDTIQTLAAMPGLGNGPFLFISSQPFSDSQEAVIRSEFPGKAIEMAADNVLIQNYVAFDARGKVIDFKSKDPGVRIRVAVVMKDTLARQTYGLLQNLQNGVVRECPSLKRRPSLKEASLKVQPKEEL